VLHNEATLMYSRQMRFGRAGSDRWRFRHHRLHLARAAFNYGLFQLNFGMPSNPAVYRPVETVHQLLVYALLALAGLHAAMALWHQIVRRDGILLRMLPGGSS
jgi:cytochrome b561